MSRIFYHFDGLKGWNKVEIDSNPLLKAFPRTLTDNSYYVPNTEQIRAKDARTAITPTAFDVSKDSENGSVDWRLAAIRKPGLDVSEVAELALDIKQSTFDSMNKDVKETLTRENQKKAENAKMESALQSVIQANKVENTSKSE